MSTNQICHGEKVRHLLTEGTKDRLNLMVHQSLNLSYLLYTPLWETEVKSIWDIGHTDDNEEDVQVPYSST